MRDKSKEALFQIFDFSVSTLAPHERDEGQKEDVVTRIESGTLRWFGHLERMNESRLKKQNNIVNVCDGKGKRGRYYDLGKVMLCPIWLQRENGLPRPVDNDILTEYRREEEASAVGFRL
ncbi:hypothetical protein EVAR_78201_1, partial [Eumeta japonica]